MFSHDLILDALARTLREREEELRHEQAVYGLDSWVETEFHPLLARGLEDRGYRTLREQAYPHEWRRRLRTAATPETGAPEPDGEPGLTVVPAIDEHEQPIDAAGARLPLPRERQRCDLVLFPEGSTFQRLDDEVQSGKKSRRIRESGEGTLFASTARTEARLAMTGDASACPPEEAYWLEIKTVAQFAYSAGVPGPNRSYASELSRSLLSDVGKLSKDRRIHHAAAAVVLFTADQATSDHDLAIVSHRLLDRELPIQPPLRASFPVLDRVGNALCTVMLVPLSPLAHARS